ncbi:hypothetical protein K437DRAFT_19969 [Tilletiaria anomala UBC 951]|uniref:Secreted protein n=1 Tax=Tilletiaria anomala (strain ATCC 24038 / CBS 436.72 / UBC 951) TaxID=1037660 RepID=A0A066VBR0_TILAU|nr:uncharacterized protein K437DRAFT_19969 [Tilletiaria anomala UBC 951]KDN38866.1 hypothetical protein K437DRAFT_19969 [Tilletiaria anomala UBC 951]
MYACFSRRTIMLHCFVLRRFLRLSPSLPWWAFPSNRGGPCTAVQARRHLCLLHCSTLSASAVIRVHNPNPQPSTIGLTVFAL